MPDVVSLGEALIDFFGRPVGVALKEATSFIPAPGGAPANVAVALARLGVDVGFIGAVGDDPFGEQLIDLLRKEGVDVTHFRKVSESPTTVALVATASPVDQDFTIYRGADMMLDAGKLDRAYIASARAFLFGSVTLSGESRDAIFQAVRWANEEDVLVVYDANFRPALWSDLTAARDGLLAGMRGIDVCKLNETEIELLAETVDPAAGSRWVLEHGPRLCLITLGAEGAYFNNGRSEGQVPSFTVDAVDTTGCGDAFCAGLTVGLLESGQALESLSGPALERIVCFANAVSAISATQNGAMAALPRRNEVDDFLRQRMRNDDSGAAVGHHQPSGTLPMSEAIAIGNRRELFVDHALIARLEDARLVLHRPQPQEVVLTCDARWETGAPGYATINSDGDGYRMYYRANPGGSGEDRDKMQLTCYVESDDGINWSRPELGIFDFMGSRCNNIVWQGVISHNLTPFRDENPDCPADQKYKAVGGVGMGLGGLWALTSSDGIRWSQLGDHPLTLKGNFDSQNLIFWDAERGQYRAYWRDHRRNDPNVPEGRDIKTAVSTDFATWSKPRWLDYDPTRSGSEECDQTDDRTGDHHQLYTSNVQPYYRAPHLLLAFPARYSDRGWTPSTDALPNQEERRSLADQGVAGGRPTRLGTALWDTLFMASRDGQAFTVWPEAFVRPGIQRQGNWFYGQAACVWGIVETASSFAGAPPELSFYVHDNARVDEHYRLRRHTLRLDGFASVFAPLTGGQVLTKALQFKGSQLEINFSTSAGGRLRVEIQDEHGRAISGFGLEDCHLQYGDQLDRVVSWKQGADVGNLAGKPVSLRFELKDADLYSFRFQG